jgi:hypothetical protein
MATLPRASTTLDVTGGALASGEGLCIIIAAVDENADATLRVYSGAQGIYDQHSYSQGLSYAASHIEKTGKPVGFIGIPVATAGVCGGRDSTLVTGTSRLSVSAAASGYREAVDGIFEVVRGGTVGTDAITAKLSCDAGRSYQNIKIGTSSSYTISKLGAILNFGAGTLVAGDVFYFRTTAPMWDAVGMASARTAMVSQQKLSRTWMVIGDCTPTLAGNVKDEVNSYETSNQRYTLASVNMKDRGPLARMSKDMHRMVGTNSLTFAAAGDTITRLAGSFTDEGFAVGDVVTVAGAVASSGANNVTSAITILTPTVMTLGGATLTDEGPITTATISGSPGLTFAEVGLTADTITRSAGSWSDDGFAVNDWVKVAGTASNNFSATVASKITVLTPTVMTLDSQDLAAEVIASHLVSVTKEQTKTAWMAAQDVAFAGIAAQRRINISAGMATLTDPNTSWSFRRPASWHDSLRAYGHQENIATWEKDHGPLSWAGFADADGQDVEFDERVDGGGLSGNFTCLRTWGNGPVGVFVAMSLTREVESSILNFSHNMQVANIYQTIVQAETENFIGRNLVLKKDGTAEEASLAALEGRVNEKLKIGLLSSSFKEGQKASIATWTANRGDVLNVPNATINGAGDLGLNGTIVNVETSVRVRQNG